jgi:hypothetical protein
MSRIRREMPIRFIEPHLNGIGMVCHSTKRSDSFNSDSARAIATRSARL